MIEQQIKPWNVFDQRLLGAMSTVPREKFVPEAHRNLAYADIAIPLGHNQSMLAPRELARMIQALDLTGYEKVLEIGCGSGYASALLSKLVRKVYSVDIISDFVKDSQKRLKQLAFNNVFIEEVDAADGWLAQAPYDAILITSALPELTDSLKRSLTSQGKVAAVLGTAGSFTVNICQLSDDKQWRCEALFPLNATPMLNTEQPNQFVF